MGVVVPVLRLIFVFLNIWETFKVLKLPRPSARNGGQPSVRALTQRKRSMKGVMTVWMVWCCYAAYEKTLDSIVGIFIPFYDELKSLLLLFFIITRARGAEPVYLHIMRPMIKPYSTTIDGLLDTTSSIADFIWILLAWPGHAFMSWYRNWTSSRSREEDDNQRLSTSEVLSQRPFVVPQQSRARRRIAGATTALRASTITRSSDLDIVGGRQIWYPPPPAYEQEESNLDGLPRFNVPQSSTRVDPPLASSEYVDEWRKYPDFPSAYPPTPVIPPKILRIVAPVPKRPSDVINFVDISEEGESSDSQVEGTEPNRIHDSGQKKGGMDDASIEKETIQPDFHRSLLESFESMNPDSHRHLSDVSNLATGVRTVLGVECTPNEKASSSDEEEHEVLNITLRTPKSLGQRVDDDDDDDGDLEVSDIEQDSFDFKTPKPKSLRIKQDLLKPRPESMVSALSNSSWQSKSTTLSTTDGGSSLRTQTGSESESSRSVSDSSSTLGRKRPFPGSHGSQDTVQARSRAPTMSRSSSSGDAIPVKRSGPVRTQSRFSSKTGDEDNEGEDDIDRINGAPAVIKKRKVAGPTRVTGRPRKNAPLPSAPVRATSHSKDAVPPVVRRSTRTVASKHPPFVQAGILGDGIVGSRQ